MNPRGTTVAHGCRESDSPIVSAKLPNNDLGAPRLAEGVERRGLAKGNAGEQTRGRTQCRGTLSHALDCVRQTPFSTCASAPKAGARCGSAARRDLCGGCWVTGIPTATKQLSRQRGGNMDVRAGGGSLWGIPVAGGVLSLTGADAGQLLAAASGLVTTVVKAGSLVLGLGLAGAYLLLKSAEKRMPVSSMAGIEAPGRRFNGIIMTDQIEIIAGGQHLTIPMQFVRAIKTGDFLYNKGRVYSVELVDGSSYAQVSFNNPVLDCLSLAGRQTIDVNERGSRLVGHTVEGIRVLRDNLAFALHQSADEAVKLISVKVFERYFQRAT